jgi:hypothetical protein
MSAKRIERTEYLVHGFPLGKSVFPKAFWHLSNGFSGLEKYIMRSAKGIAE